MDNETQRLIFQATDQTITADELDRLQDAIERSPEVRQAYLRAVHLRESLEEMATSEMDAVVSLPAKIASPLDRGDAETAQSIRRADSVSGISWAHVAIAASVIAIISGLAIWVGRTSVTGKSEQVAAYDFTKRRTTESLIAGHATLRRSVDVQWSDDALSFHEGDVLPSGMLQFESGIMEIDVFCGASPDCRGPGSPAVRVRLGSQPGQRASASQCPARGTWLRGARRRFRNH